MFLYLFIIFMKGRRLFYPHLRNRIKKLEYGLEFYILYLLLRIRFRNLSWSKISNCLIILTKIDGIS